MQNVTAITQTADQTLIIPNDVAIITGSGAPSDGTTGAGVAGLGSLYIRTDTGKFYINGGAGTKASPVWKLVTSA